MKVFFRRIHLYLSLAAGAVILVCCLTGAILVFEKDLQMTLNKDRYFVVQSGERQTLAQLTEGLKQSHPPYKINSIKLYDDSTRSVEFNVSARPKKDKKEPKAGQPAAAGKGKEASARRQPGFTLFVNPYTGAVLDTYNYRETFFYQVFALHRWLLGSEGSIGKYIVGVSTLIFLFILLTGIILWWPKTRKVLRQRLRVKWDAGWKRINHDFHLVLGFYSAIFLFIFAFTGLAWSFEWFNKGIYTVTNSPIKPPAPPQSVYLAGAKTVSLDQALATARAVHPAGAFYNISLPKDSAEAISVTVLSQDPAHESATDLVYLDQYTGSIVGQQPFEARSAGAKVRSYFKPIHTGSLWGTPSRIVAFVVCLLGVTFPITGTIMWVNRTRKNIKKTGARQEVRVAKEVAA